MPYEFAYSRWLTGWVLRLCDDAGHTPSEELLIVAAAQHVERWKVPRSSYPEVGRQIVKPYGWGGDGERRGEEQLWVLP